MVCWNIGCCCYHSFTFIGVPMKTQEDLYLEYARVITMVHEYNDKHGSDVKPWECVKYINSGEVYFDSTPDFVKYESPLREWQFAIAILEGKPVFVGDILYGKSSGRMVNAKQGHIWDLFTWTPPQKKRTFMLNGVDLPCPVNHTDNVVKLTIDTKEKGGVSYFRFDSHEDAEKVELAIFNLLERARDKE